MTLESVQLVEPVGEQILPPIVILPKLRPKLVPSIVKAVLPLVEYVAGVTVVIVGALYCILTVLLVAVDV